MATFGIDRFLNIRSAIGADVLPRRPLRRLPDEHHRRRPALAGARRGRLAGAADLHRRERPWRPLQPAQATKCSTAWTPAATSGRSCTGCTASSDTDHGLGDGWTSTDLTQAPEGRSTLRRLEPRRRARSPSAPTATTPAASTSTCRRSDGTAARLVAKGPGGYYAPPAGRRTTEPCSCAAPSRTSTRTCTSLDVETGKARHLTPHKGDAQYHSPTLVRTTARRSTAPPPPAAATWPAWRGSRWPTASSPTWTSRSTRSSRCSRRPGAAGWRGWSTRTAGRSCTCATCGPARRSACRATCRWACHAAGVRPGRRPAGLRLRRPAPQPRRLGLGPGRRQTSQARQACSS